MNRALVTGATGMLGSHVVERLVAQGWAVRALVRRPEGARWVEGLGAEVRAGNLLDAPSITAAVRGCDAVIHAAAVIGAGAEPGPFVRGNVQGTRHVLEAAAAARARVVHVSSTAVLGEARFTHVPADETVPLPVLPVADHYGRTKQEAERLALEGHDAGRWWATVVRPPMMYGVRDRQFAPRLAGFLEKRVFPLIGGGRNTLNLVHVGAVADGIVLALGHEEAGGRVYHLTDDFPVTVADLARYASEGLGWRIWTPTLPTLVGRAGFTALGLALRLLGRGELAPHAAGTFRTLTRDNPFTSARARRELGWAPTMRPEEGIPAAFSWWRERAGLPSPAPGSAGAPTLSPAGGRR